MNHETSDRYFDAYHHQFDYAFPESEYRLDVSYYTN